MWSMSSSHLHALDSAERGSCWHIFFENFDFRRLCPIRFCWNQDKIFPKMFMRSKLCSKVSSVSLASSMELSSLATEPTTFKGSSLTSVIISPPRTSLDPVSRFCLPQFSSRRSPAKLLVSIASIPK